MSAIEGLRAGLLAEETALLQQAGFTVPSVVDDASGWTITVVAPDATTSIGPVTLTVRCGPSYPLTPPTVFAEQLGLEHHQNPFTGELCLLEQPTQRWRVDWRLAGFLADQLPKLIAAGRHDADLKALDEEIDQAEPFSLYYPYRRWSGVLIDGAGLGELSGRGDLTVSWVVTPSLGGQGRLLGLVEEIRAGSDAYAASPELQKALLPGAPRRAKGRWVALNEAPVEQNPAVLWRTYVNSGDKLPHVQIDGLQLQLLGLVFPEESSRHRKTSGWAFVLREVTAGSKPSSRRGTDRPSNGENFHFVRAYRAAREELTYRAPNTAGLSKKAVTIVGCGAIGSVIAEHLARAGVGSFCLVDHDHLEPGNLARHSGAFDAVGMAKVDAVALRIAQVNPYAQVTMCTAALGTGFVHRGMGETAILGEMIGASDLVIDATADVSLQQYAASLALDRGVQCLVAEGTRGLAGGTVVTSPSASGGCYWCFQFHQVDGSIPTANVVDTDDVQPAGCGQRTFTGTGFDLAVISAQASRVAVGTLLTDAAEGYATDGNDVHILTLRTPDGTPSPPSWAGFTYGRHTKCRLH